jgi:hypothetical protein
MNGTRFDSLVRTLSTTRTRRGLMRGLAAFSVGGVLAPNRAAARPVPGGADVNGPTTEGTDTTCKGSRAVNNKTCTANLCVNSSCNCAVSVTGDKKCVSFAKPFVCPTVDECDRTRDCATGEVCVKVGGCCDGRKFNQCVPHCV